MPCAYAKMTFHFKDKLLVYRGVDQCACVDPICFMQWRISLYVTGTVYDTCYLTVVYMVNVKCLSPVLEGNLLLTMGTGP